MEEKGRLNKSGETILISPENIPFCFAINISEADAQGNSHCGFTVTANDLNTGTKKACEYHIPDREHHTYLDVFEKLATDFGLRLPQNRQPQIQYNFKANYQVLLTKNLVPEMLYGYGDPAVLKVEQDNEIWYYVVTTSNDAPDSFPVIRSKNFKDWEFVSFVFPKDNKPSWAANGEFISDYWAPEMHKINNEFRIYFVARDKITSELCIGMARSSSPGGPFIAYEQPILKDNKIDPHIFVENKNTTFLFWKEDNNAVWPNRLIDLLYEKPELISDLFITQEDKITASFITTLWPWIQKLNSMEAFLVQQNLIEAVIADFLEFKKRLVRQIEKQTVRINDKILSVIETMRTPVYAQQLSDNGSILIGEKRLVIENDQEWEAHLVEGCWVTKYNNKYYLFYSGNDFSTDQYGIGVAIADKPLGPYKKMPAQILRSTEEWWAPGHPSLSIAPDGKPYLFFHAYFPGKAGYKEFRALLGSPIKLFADKVVLDQ